MVAVPGSAGAAQGGHSASQAISRGPSIAVEEASSLDSHGVSGAGSAEDGHHVDHEHLQNLSAMFVESIMKPSVDELVRRRASEGDPDARPGVNAGDGADVTPTEDGNGDEAAADDAPPPERLLSEEEIRGGLSDLGRSAEGGIAFLSFSARGAGITSAGFLERFSLLQRVDLASNSLSDVTPVGALRHLFALSLRHNHLTRCPGFDEPPNLQAADFGHNRLETIDGFSPGSALRELNLESNRLTRVGGLDNCRMLTELNLAGNILTDIEGLRGLESLRVLQLQNNRIASLEPLTTVTSLERLDVSANHVATLEGLESLTCLLELIAADNAVETFDDARSVSTTITLSHIDLRGNPLTESVDYRTEMLFRMRHLTTLDGTSVAPEEKVAAMNLFDPPPETVAAIDHAVQAKASLKNRQSVRAFHLASEEDVYPMLVLVGPAASGKRGVMHLLTRGSDVFVHCRSHTTRRSANDADVGGSIADYHHVSFQGFQQMVADGNFLQTYRYCDELYGICRHEIERIVEAGRIPVALVEIEGAFILKKSSMRPLYVYVRPDLSGVLGNAPTPGGLCGGLGESAPRVRTDSRLAVHPTRLAQYEKAARDGNFDAVVTLGKGDVADQIAPVRTALLERLARVKDQVMRHIPALGDLGSV